MVNHVGRESSESTIGQRLPEYKSIYSTGLFDRAQESPMNTKDALGSINESHTGISRGPRRIRLCDQRMIDDFEAETASDWIQVGPKRNRQGKRVTIDD
jgi:hypothetical protein